VLTLEAVSGRTGEVLAREQTMAEGKENILNALSQAATKLRESLGESIGSMEKFDKPLEVTTSSLEALKAFSLGNELREKGAHLEAVPFFKRAIELDPNFASAYVLLAMTYHNTGQFGMKAELAAKAYALRDRVTERERLRITDRYYAYVSHQDDKHVETLQVIKRTYPRDPSGPFWLSDVYFAIGQFEKAVEEATEGIRRSPSFGLAYINLAQALIPLNRFDEAREVSEGLLQRQVDHSDIHSYLYQIAFVYGDSGGMLKQLDWARGRADEYVAFDWQADTAAFAGHWQRAQEFSQSAIDLAARGSAKDPAAKYAAKLAAFSAAFGGCVQARESATQALALNQSEWPQTLALIGLALCGESTRALQAVEEYSRRFPNDTWFNAVWLPTVRAAVELQRGNAARAIELLEPTVRYEGASQFWSQYLRGQAYLKLNRGAEAAAEFQKILDHRGEAPLSALYPLAHLGLARAAALMREGDKSRKAYEQFFVLWGNADSDIPILQRAKREYGKLKSS
jgi:predicted Zn-dependent protease